MGRLQSSPELNRTVTISHCYPLFFTVPRVGVKDICIQKKELIVCSAEVYYDFFSCTLSVLK